jgi:hypothetical protein
VADAVGVNPPLALGLVAALAITHLGLHRDVDVAGNLVFPDVAAKDANLGNPTSQFGVTVSS